MSATTSQPIFSLAARRTAWVLVAGGLTAFATGALVQPARAWAAWLTASFFFLTIALGALLLVALFTLTGAGWSAVVKRVAEGIAGWLPVGSLAMLALVGGAAVLYPWAEKPALAKGGWLSVPLYAGRMVGFLALWVLLARAQRRTSLQQDADPAQGLHRRQVGLSAAFVIVFGFTFSLAVVDWVVSLDPKWGSTIFGWYNIGGVLVSGAAALTLATVTLRRLGLLPAVNESHLHDLGKLLFALSTLWAYLWFSQFLLIWYSNIPDEGSWYLRQWRGGWSFLFWLNPILGWLAPFLLLLPRPAKRDEMSLLRVSVLLLAAHWLDVYMMVAPPVMRDHLGIGAIELGALACVGGVFHLVVERALESAPLIPRGDPFLEESLHHHQ